MMKIVLRPKDKLCLSNALGSLPLRSFLPAILMFLTYLAVYSYETKLDSADGFLVTFYSAVLLFLNDCQFQLPECFNKAESIESQVSKDST